MRVSNEPCTDRPSNARRELAHERAVDGLAVYGECRDSEQTPCVCEPVGNGLAVYGECRDSEQTPCVCEPVGMANCVPTESTDKATVRRVELARTARGGSICCAYAKGMQKRINRQQTY